MTRTSTAQWLTDSILSERDEFMKQPPSSERTENIAACDRLLERIARNAAKLPRPLSEKERQARELIWAVLNRLPPAETGV